jgi:hypothetical protein
MGKLFGKMVLLCMVLIPFMVQAQKNVDPKENPSALSVSQRADKIISKLKEIDAAKEGKLRRIVEQHLMNINAAHENFRSQVSHLKQTPGEDKESVDSKINTLEKEMNQKLEQLHSTYIAELSKLLNTEQVDRIKNGMTNNILPLTYKSYTDMIPFLTSEQKAKILAWLTEAREHALDSESSEKINWWFRKYKSKINSYLSKEGIDVEKARKDWQARQNQKETPK